MNSRYSPPPQRPRRLPPLIEEDPFKYRQPIEFDLSPDTYAESGTSPFPNRILPHIFTSDQAMTNHPEWEDYSDEVI